MNEPVISVIVPVYNVQNYMGRCVESILAQTYTKLDIILVDDGSTDASGKICDEFAKKDVRIRIIHKENGGLSDARNAGMQEARGEYYAFVDSDDYIAADYIAYLYHLMHTNQAQISSCGYEKVCEGQEDIKNSVCNENDSLRVFNSHEGLFHLLYQRGMFVSAWGRLFKADLFGDIRFPKGKLHEDVAVLYKLYDAADRIVCGSKIKYYYLQRSDSIINVKFDKRRMDYLFFTAACIQYMAEHHPDLRKAAISRHFSACFDLLSCIGNIGNENVQEYRQIVSEIKKYRKTVLCDRNARLKNRLAAAGAYISIACVRRLSCMIRRP